MGNINCCAKREEDNLDPQTLEQRFIKEFRQTVSYQNFPVKKKKSRCSV